MMEICFGNLRSWETADCEDMLEIHQVLKLIEKPWYIADIV
jgi:hypothetical protein